jgi:hypothetical protein
MSNGTLTGAPSRSGSRVPDIRPLVTTVNRSPRWFPQGPISLPPLRVNAGTRRSPDELFGWPATPQMDWRDDSPGFHLGEAEPEDELPLLRGDPGYAIEAAASAPVEPTATPGAALIDPARAAEMAGRLESMARALREQGPAGLLLTQGRDPLAALITGYLVGYLEGTAPREPGGSG